MTFGTGCTSEPYKHDFQQTTEEKATSWAEIFQ